MCVDRNSELNQFYKYACMYQPNMIEKNALKSKHFVLFEQGKNLWQSNMFIAVFREFML